MTLVPRLAAVEVAGVPIDDVTMDETVDVIDAFVSVGRQSGRTFQVATVNVDFVVNAINEPDVDAILRNSELNVPDGRPILWHASLTGAPLRARVAGVDLIPQLVDRGRRDEWRTLLFGSAEGVAEHAAQLLVDRYPGAIVTGISGPMLRDPSVMDQRWIDEIRAFRPDVICVALGNPKQERWIAAHRHALGASVLIGVGGTLDFLVGGRRRAPVFIQRVGLEWVFRAAQEPRRLGRRYMRDAVAFGPVFGRALMVKLRRNPVHAATLAAARDQLAGERDTRRSGAPA